MISGTISTRNALIGIALLAVMPLWLGQAWVAGLFNVSKEYPISGIEPSFEQLTNASKERVVFCLGKNWSDKLSLQKVRSPNSKSETIRFRNRPQHVVVDVAQIDKKAVVKAYKVNGGELSPDHVLALQSCVYNLRTANTV